MHKFQSFLSKKLESFINFKTATGHWNGTYEQSLRLFDRHCASMFPNETNLTDEIINSWCAQRKTEINNSCRVRIYSVVHFVNYLRERGETNISPLPIPKMERSVYIPHAFTDEELSAFFKASDRLPSLPNSLTVRMRRVVVPVFFRLLYSSGIRTCEARHLCVDDVDLSQGVVNVKKSKGHAQHYIVLHDTMTELLRKYDQTISAIRPKRVSFFPSPRGSFLSNTWVVYNFNNLWQKSISPNATAYGLRHNYAVKNINEWIGGGSEVFSKLVYLSKSMGHLSLESTKGYCHLVPIMSNILLDLTGDGFDSIVPEVCDEKSYR